MALRDNRSYETQIIDAVRSVNKALGGTYGTSSAIYQSEFNQYEVQLIDAIKGIAKTLGGSGLSVYGGADVDTSGLVTKEEFDVLTRRVTKLENESFFRLVDGNVTLKAEYSNLWVPGWLAAGGIGSGGSGGSSVSVTQILTSGTAIATITVDGVATTLYAPSGGGGSGTVTSVKVGATAYNPDANGVISLPAYPSSLSQLSADSTHRLVTDTQISTWNGKQDTISDLSTIRSGAALGMTALQYESDPTVPSWAKASSKPTYTFAEITSKPTTLAGYGITDAKFGTAGSDYIPVTLGSSTVNVLTAHQSLTPITNRLDAIETWFEVLNVGTQSAPVYALHAKNGYAIYSDSWVSAGGVGSGGGSGGGMDLSRMWASLTNYTSDAYASTKINIAHIPNITTSYISNLETWIAGKGYVTSSDLSSYALKTGGSDYEFRVLELQFSSTTALVKGGTSAAPRIQWEYVNNSTVPATTVTKTLAYTDEIPTSLKNPYSLTFGSKTYDGSSAKTITASDLGALTSHQTIYALTLSAGSFTAGSYDPKTAAASFNVPTSLDHITDGSTRKLADYVTLSTTQTITGAKTFSAGITASNGITVTGDIIPSADLGSQLGYSTRRFSNISGRTYAAQEINFKLSSDTSKTSGYLGFGSGWMTLRTSSSGIDTSDATTYKQISFHQNYGFYPETSGVNLGYNGTNYRWATIYGVNGNLTGDLVLASTSHIDIGPVRLEYANEALHVTTSDAAGHPTIGLYADGFVAAGGTGSGGNTYMACVYISQQDYNAIEIKSFSTMYLIGNAAYVSKIYVGSILIYQEN